MNKKQFKIYTSNNGEIVFTKNDLSKVVTKVRIFYFFKEDFKQKYQSLTNHMAVLVDLNKMFVFIETNYGDFAEYKIFKI